MKRVIVLLFSLVWITSFTTTVQAEGVTNIKKTLFLSSLPDINDFKFVSFLSTLKISKLIYND